MRVLLTGGAGFIGGALASRLERDGHRVYATARDGLVEADCQVLYGDLRDLAFAERAMAYAYPEAVFHLAAQAYVPIARRDPWGTMEDNVRGTYNLLEAFRRHAAADATLVVASSDKAYGETTLLPCRESDALSGQGPYDVSKACADLLAQAYGREFGLRIGVVRCGNVYGPGDSHPTRLIPSLVEDMLAGIDAVIRSDGTPVRDYLYVDDAVEGYLAVERYLRGLDWELLANGGLYARAFNLAGGEAVSVREVAERIEATCGELGLAVNGEIVVCGTRTGEIQNQQLDTSRARALLGWTPAVTLNEGLRRTVRAAAVGHGRLTDEQADSPQSPL